MEDSFSVRVDKTFGALRGGPESSSAGVTPALWCLTDDEIERREWNRDKVEDVRDCGVESVQSDVRIRMEMDLQELTEEEDEEGEEDGGIDGGRKKRRRNSGGGAENTAADEYLEVQSNIGRDPTLDYEEEEDEYDKVAVPTKHRGDRIFMRDVKASDYEVDEPSAYGELPNTLHDVIRDPRANHTAAKMRLKEDAEAAGNFDTLQLSDDSVTTDAAAGDHKKEDSRANPKPILKKGENTMDSRGQKRVRFLVDPKSSNQTPETNLSGATCLTSETHSEPHSDDGSASQEQSSELSLYSSGIPDYIRNPSKYTRYTFDASDDMDDKSNQKAYMDFFQQLRKKNDNDSSMDDNPVETPKSVTFVPRRKPQDESMVKKDQNMQDACKNKSWSIGVTAEDAQESEISAMEEDDPTLPKPGRQYRTRTNVEDADDL